MTASQVKLNGTYRLKDSVLNSAVQIDGSPLVADVTIVRMAFRPGYKRAWYFDAKGNAYHSSDFSKATEVIEVEF